MVSKGRPKQPIRLPARTRRRLVRLARAKAGDGRLVQRARIILASARGSTNLAVARREGVTAQMVGKWRQRFLQDGLAGLSDAPRSGARPKVDETMAQRIVDVARFERPRRGSRWTTRSLGLHFGLSHDTIHRVLRRFYPVSSARKPAWVQPEYHIETMAKRKSA